jgi:hypothetical protein
LIGQDKLREGNQDLSEAYVTLSDYISKKMNGGKRRSRKTRKSRKSRKTKKSRKTRKV